MGQLKRIADGWYTYILLDLTQRWGLPLDFDGSESEIENAIMKNFNLLKTAFRRHWSDHKCQIKGCGEVLVCDGGMTPHRMVCAARYSGIRTYKQSDIKTVVGCGNKPGNNSAFCKDHQEGEQGPVVLAENLSRETRQTLRKGQHSSFPQDNVFFIKSLLLYNEESDSFLVRWANSQDDNTTWEKSEMLPKFIIDFYKEDLSRLGQEIPKPRIKWTKEGGPGEKFHFLSWGKSGSWVNDHELQDSIYDLEFSMSIPESSCNTRKEKDKRSRRHTVGLHIVTWPCGVIPDFGELFGSESITQVWAMICDFLGDMNEDKRNQLKAFLYDDACHLKPFSEKENQRKQSKSAEFFATLNKAVDKLHFRGHRGSYCQQECDPWKLKDLNDVNTPVCEQTFSWLNRYKNCRNMNEGRFFLYFLYLIDMRNNEKEKKLRRLLHPFSKEKFTTTCLSSETKQNCVLNFKPEEEKEDDNSENLLIEDGT